MSLLMKKAFHCSLFFGLTMLWLTSCSSLRGLGEVEGSWSFEQEAAGYLPGVQSLELENLGENTVRVEWLSKDGRMRLQATLLPYGDLEMEIYDGHLLRLSHQGSGRAKVAYFMQAEIPFAVEMVMDPPEAMEGDGGG